MHGKLAAVEVRFGARVTSARGNAHVDGGPKFRSLPASWGLCSLRERRHGRKGAGRGWKSQGSGFGGRGMRGWHLRWLVWWRQASGQADRCRLRPCGA